MLALVVAAVAVGLDNFGASIGLGLLPQGRRYRWAVAAVFGCFEAGMPALGLVIGSSLSNALAGTAPIIGGALLVAMGVYSVVRELWRPSAESGPGPGHRRGGRLGIVRLVALGAVLSIDNLVVGFALGTYHVSLVEAVLVIGAASVGLSLVGLELGRRLGGRLGERSELVGGVALIAVGALVASGVH